MLEYRVTPSSFQTRQFIRGPSVYLDHWAFGAFSRDLERRQGFTDALEERNGSLALGRLNLLEFSRVTDPCQLRAAEDFVQSVLPRIFFINTTVMQVVERESAFDPGACGDQELFAEFGAPLLDGESWRAGILFERLRIGRQEYARAFDTLEDSLLAALDAYRDVDERTLRRALQEGQLRPRATLGLARALMDEIHRDKTRPLDESDTSDLMHAVVPCAYCDFVLLDGEWCDYIARARNRLEQSGPARQQHVAAVYSRRGDGLARFLEALRAHPKDPRPPPPWID
jgi:hypothetical protein